MVKNKEIECDAIERKLRAMKTFASTKLDLPEDNPENQSQYVKQIDKLQKEVRHYEDMHHKLQDQVTRKDENLRKHTTVVEKLFDKYKDLCAQNDIEPKIKLEKNAEGVIEVTLVEYGYESHRIRGSADRWTSRSKMLK